MNKSLVWVLFGLCGSCGSVVSVATSDVGGSVDQSVPTALDGSTDSPMDLAVSDVAMRAIEDLSAIGSSDGAGGAIQDFSTANIDLTMSSIHDMASASPDMGCVPNNNACVNKNCGSVTNNCNQTVSCGGACGAAQSCNANVCTCIGGRVALNEYDIYGDDSTNQQDNHCYQQLAGGPCSLVLCPPKPTGLAFAIYPSPEPGLVPLYQCNNSGWMFLSTDGNCEGYARLQQAPMGYCYQGNMPPCGATPLHRLVAANGTDHVSTPDPAVRQLFLGKGYKQEADLCYVWFN